MVGSVMSAWTQGVPNTAANGADTAASASYVGLPACKACHAKIYDPWLISPHGKALEQGSLPAEFTGCEACHGPGSRHIATGAQEKPRVLKADNPNETNAVCGTCHFESDSSKAPAAWQEFSGTFFDRSAHGRKGLSCLSCHTGHPGPNEKELIKPVESLCVGCHGSVMEDSPGKKAAYIHSPVAAGKCAMCHDPHASANRDLTVPDLRSVCQGCHDAGDPKMTEAHKGYPVAEAKCVSCHDPHSHDKKGKLIASTQHMPFKQGRCETCHTKPSPGQPVGLVKPAKELCLSCHPASVLMPEGEKAHLPAKEGICTACHNPHASSRKELMRTRTAYACFTCHSKVEGDTVEAHRHKILEADLNCVLCHKPHSSKQENLLTRDEMTLCSQCHKHSFSHPMGTKADGSAVIDPSTGKSLVCAGCHDVHGSKLEAMTKADKSRELCVGCHIDLRH
ncbi:MAG: hypothetical protein A2Z18_04310 [Armatimonadetes bacterium RBG_16_58_9]|nr:MAG: hypothetical protein A2Z18_04310 [Armatimonadetes bacterium RBG_16_58_9]